MWRCQVSKGLFGAGYISLGCVPLYSNRPPSIGIEQEQLNIVKQLLIYEVIECREKFKMKLAQNK